MKQSLARKYNIKNLEEIKIIIGWQITRDTALSTMKIRQSAVIWDLVIEKKLTKCNPIVISMKARSIIKMTEPKNYEEMNLHIYQQLIDKLMYLLCGTKSDIFFVVEQFSRYNADPTKDHFWAAKRIVQYLWDTMVMSLIYGQKLNSRMLKDTPPIVLIEFADSRFIGGPEDRKSLIGYCFFMNDVVVS